MFTVRKSRTPCLGQTRVMAHDMLSRHPARPDYIDMIHAGDRVRIVGLNLRLLGNDFVEVEEVEVERESDGQVAVIHHAHALTRW